MINRTHGASYTTKRDTLTANHYQICASTHHHFRRPKSPFTEGTCLSAYLERDAQGRGVIATTQDLALLTITYTTTGSLAISLSSKERVQIIIPTPRPSYLSYETEEYGGFRLWGAVTKQVLGNFSWYARSIYLKM